MTYNYIQDFINQSKRIGIDMTGIKNRTKKRRVMHSFSRVKHIEKKQNIQQRLMYIRLDEKKENENVGID